jgi:hypothetical protein
MVQRTPRTRETLTRVAVQVGNTEDISGAALRDGVEADGAEGRRVVGRDGGGEEADESDDRVLHLEDGKLFLAEKRE